MRPIGVGVYLRAPTRRWRSPEALAKRLEEHGVSVAYFAGPWHQFGKKRKLITPPHAFGTYAKTLRARGFTVGLWGYPDARMLDEWHEDLAKYAREFEPSLFLADPEKHFRVKRADEDARRFTEAQREVFGDSCAFGVTSFGNIKLAVASGLEGWSEDCLFVSPQIYTVGHATALKTLRAWSAKVAHWSSERRRCPEVELAPSFGLFKRNESGRVEAKSGEELRSHLRAFTEALERSKLFHLIGWSENFMRASHKKPLRELNEKLFAAAALSA